MLSPKERLDHLLELAEKGPTMRAALAEELADLLLDWPQDCPRAMRLPCERLLERAAWEMNGAQRAELSKRIGSKPRLPLPFLNALFFHAPEQLKQNILSRNALSGPAHRGIAADETALITEARDSQDFAGALARIIGVSQEIAENILADASGQSLAAACRGALVSRAAFSALAVLLAERDRINAWLEGYETVPQPAAERLMQSWRAANSSIHEAAE